jgi:hypothetical protein
VGPAVPASAIPLIAADLTQDKARLFTVDDSVAHAHTLPVLGEVGGQLYLQPSVLAAGSRVVLEGRATLNDKDPVEAHEIETAAATDAGASEVEGLDPGSSGESSVPSAMPSTTHVPDSRGDQP